MLSQKKIDLTNLLRGDTSIIVPNLITLSFSLDIFSASKFYSKMTFYQQSTVVKLGSKNLDLRKLLRGDTSNIVPNLRTLGLVLDTFSTSKVLP